MHFSYRGLIMRHHVIFEFLHTFAYLYLPLPHISSCFFAAAPEHTMLCTNAKWKESHLKTVIIRLIKVCFKKNSPHVVQQ